jgi:1,2-diacylglycerol 3-alpha-glucosyltransferase
LSSKPRVVIVCPGLGIVERGFERAAEGIFGALRDSPSLDVHLVRGRGPAAQGESVAWTVSRETALARAAARLRGHQDFWLEQLCFSVTVQPHLIRLSPRVVMLGEWTLTKALHLWRRATGQRFRTLLYNGAGAGPPYPPGTDHIQQLTPDLFERAISLGVPAECQTVLPHALSIPSGFEPAEVGERRRLRRTLGLPVEGPLLLSVGALNAWSKRMDYLIEEVATLDSPPHLLMLGARDVETPRVLALAKNLLGESGYTVRTVPHERMPDYYRAADVFVLASGHEGFGLAMVEALSHGLPVVAQDSPRSRYILGDTEALGNFIHPGALAKLLRDVLVRPQDTRQARERHLRAYEMFSWDRLAPAYVEMLLATSGRADG